MCLKYWSLDYDECLQLSLLPSLEECGRLCYLHNIVHNNIDFSIAPVVNRVPTRMTRHSNNLQLVTPRVYKKGKESVVLRIAVCKHPLKSTEVKLHTIT